MKQDHINKREKSYEMFVRKQTYGRVVKENFMPMRSNMQY